MKASSLVLALVALLPLATVQAKPDAPNILVIMADDMGFNDIEPFGQEIIQTPVLQQMAQRGQRFSNFHVHPTCSPTRAQLLTGVDNHMAGMGSMGEYRTPEMEQFPGSYIGAMNDRVKTFAEVVKDKGYVTFMAGKWHLGGKPEYLPSAKGFDQSFVLVGPGASHWDDSGLLGVQPVAKFMENGQPIARDTGEFSSDLYTRKFIEYMDQALAQDKPFVGYLAFQAMHDPLHAPASYITPYKGKFAAGYDQARQDNFESMKRLGVVPEHTRMGDPAPLFKAWTQLDPAERAEQERLMEIYAAMITNMDDNIGKVLERLQASGQLDNTYIFFFSDNGPSGAYMGLYPGNADGSWINKQFDTSFDNLGAPKSFAGVGPGWAYASSAPFRLFKMFVTEGGTISPLIVVGPGVQQQGAINDAYLGVEDIFPTILELTGTLRGTERNGVPLAPLKGVSIKPLLTGEVTSVRPDDFERGEELFGNKAYRKGKWRISWLPKPYGEARWQLFDMEADRGETQDLSERYPDLTQDLVAKYEQWAKNSNVMDWDMDFLHANLFGYYDWRKGMPVQIRGTP